MTLSCLTRLCNRSSITALRNINFLETVTAAPLYCDKKISKFLTCGTSKILIPKTSYPSLRLYTHKTDTDVELPKKQSLLQRIKQMYKDYWYVLVPVHLVTSAGWFGGFYYLAKSGVDIAGILESWNMNEKITNSFKDSSMGYLAIAYGLYKIATPLRYTVTLGGTTISINYLKKFGYIKPVPSKNELKEMYKEKRETFMESIREKRSLHKEKKDSLIRPMKGTKIKLAVNENKSNAEKDNILKKITKSATEKSKDALRKTEELIKVAKKDEG